MLNLDAISSTRWHSHPFAWTTYSAALQSGAAAVELRNHFPLGSMRRFRRLDGPKRHDLSGQRLRAGDDNAFAGLPAPWKLFCLEAWSDDYRRTMEAAACLSLADLEVEITLWRQEQGGFIDPHLDNEAKFLVHLVYFSSNDWNSADGGCLRILHSPDLDDFHTEIAPRLGDALIFKRSSKSWHGYPAIMRTDEPRLAAQIVFHAKCMRYSAEPEAWEARD